jgi:hypothetical protein
MRAGPCPRACRPRPAPRALIVQRVQRQPQVGHGQHALRLLGPFGQLQARLGEQVAKAGVFPFARVAEAVEVEVRDGQPGQGMGFDDGEGRALDAPLHTQRPQQVAHEGGLARAQRAMQFDVGVADGGPRRQRLRKGLAGGLVGPLQVAGF